MDKNFYFDNLINNLEKNLEFDYIIKNIINPFTPYYISNFYFGHELIKFKMPTTESIDISSKKNIEKIKDNDIIFVQINEFDKFCSNILPLIKCKFILITGQTHLPKLKKSKNTDLIINDNRIIKWFSQNPIYKNEKYFSFPYGINNGVSLNNAPQKKLIINYVKILLEKNNKNLNIINLNLRVTHPCRKIFKPEPRLNLYDFYKKMSEARFILSPIGDRDDCYRHWESIGFGTIPISNVNELYKDLFQDNMIYVNNTQEMLKLYNEQQNLDYKCPNRDLICVDYWKDYIQEKIK